MPGPQSIIIQPVSSNKVRELTTNHPGHPGYPAPVGQSAQQARVYNRFWIFHILPHQSRLPRGGNQQNQCNAVLKRIGFANKDV